MTRHILGLFNGISGARAYRRHLSENAVRSRADISVLRRALDHLHDDETGQAAA
jgi:tRNA-dihydrouridine synthase A